MQKLFFVCIAGFICCNAFSQHHITIEAPVNRSLHYMFSTMEGQKMFFGNFTDQTTIRLSGLPAGIYILEVTDETGLFRRTIKIVKN